MYRSSTGIGLIFKCLPTCPIDTLISLQVTMLLCGLAMMGFPKSKKELYRLVTIGPSTYVILPPSNERVTQPVT